MTAAVINILMHFKWFIYITKALRGVEVKLPTFLTSVRHGGKGSAAPVFGYEAKWIPEPDGTGRRKDEFLPLPGIKPQSSSQQEVTLMTELSHLINVSSVIG
jgi:hypothetical protein